MSLTKKTVPRVYPLHGVRLVPKIIVTAFCVAFASGCATDPKTGQPSFKETFASDDPCSHNARNIGIVAGGVIGAVLGNQAQHSDKARLLGAAGGAMIGGFVGNDMDRRRCELFKIAKQHNLDIQFEDIKATQVKQTPDNQPITSQNKTGATAQAVGLKVSLKDDGRQFESGSDRLVPEARVYFQQIADQYSYEQQNKRLSQTATKNEVMAVGALKGKRILLIGHTDDTGSSAFNADLSERRAKAVARLFEERGIPKDQLFFQGAGETMPIADNRVEEGRARNRRVEIIDLTDDNALRGYLANRRPNVIYYRNTPAEASAEASGQPMAPKAAEVNKSHMGRTNKRMSKVDNAGTVASVAPSRAPAQGASMMTSARKSSISASARRKPPSIDFGGEPVGNSPPAVNIGNLATSSGGFSLISSAQADEPVVGSCTQDRPRISHGVKSLKDDKEFAPRDYLLGFSDVSWSGMVNGQLVTLANVAVLKDGGTPARHPKLLVYRDYKGNVGAKSSYSSVPEVNAYRGDKAVLYRVFVNGPMRCMDFVIPNNRPVDASTNLYYDRGQALYMASFNPKVTQ